MLNDPKLVLQSISRFVNAAEILERNNYDVLDADNRQQGDYPLVDLDISLASPELQTLLKGKAAQAPNAQLSAGIIMVRASWLEAISGALEEYADCLDGNHEYEGRWCNVCGDPSSAIAHTKPLDPNGISAALANEGDEATWCAHDDHQFVDLTNSSPDLKTARKCSKCGYVDLVHVDIEHECSQCHRPLATLPDGAPEVCNCDGQYDI